MHATHPRHPATEAHTHPNDVGDVYTPESRQRHLQSRAEVHPAAQIHTAPRLPGWCLFSAQEPNHDPPQGLQQVQQPPTSENRHTKAQGGTVEQHPKRRQEQAPHHPHPSPSQARPPSLHPHGPHPHRPEDPQRRRRSHSPPHPGKLARDTGAPVSAKGVHHQNYNHPNSQDRQAPAEAGPPKQKNRHPREPGPHPQAGAGQGLPLGHPPHAVQATARHSHTLAQQPPPGPQQLTDGTYKS
ncbi:proline-rich protein 2-like [Procambarus clarkii]|uniref:proline-rich protein 2-like n=1 Tax=Procambarus clarkii TaxID=6728 RepID=UPI003742A0CA